MNPWGMVAFILMAAIIVMSISGCTPEPRHACRKEAAAHPVFDCSTPR